MNQAPTRLAIAISLFAGAMDTLTGVALVVAPTWTLAQFGVTIPGGESAAILVRYVGTFVAGVGLSYGWALVARRTERLPGVWGATAIIRAAIACFCICAVVAGAFERNWLVVVVTDVVLAIVQFIGLRRGWCLT